MSLYIENNEYAFEDEGFKIAKPIYELLKEHIMHTVCQHKEIGLKGLIEEVSAKIGYFNGNLNWHIVKVKDHLQANNFLKCRDTDFTKVIIPAYITTSSFYKHSVV